MTASSPPTVSVVVSTRNRAQLLPRLFEALAHQTHQDFELLIVDDASVDDTAAVLQQLAAAAPFKTTVLRGRGEGPAVGRELGFRQAAAPVVAFTDDDCVQSVTWLAAGLRALGERRAIVVGCTMPNPDQAANRGQFSRTLQVRNTLYFQTCNIFYRLADLEAVGGFDAGFDKPGGEDTDLALRMIDELGVEAVFAEEALVYHDISPSDFRACVRVANRWTGVARLIAKHPSTRKTFLYQRVFWKITHQRVLLAWLGLVGAIFDARTLVLVVPWLWYRARKRQSGLRVRPHAVPGRFIIDTVEVVTMIRGSVRERTFIL